MYYDIYWFRVYVDQNVWSDADAWIDEWKDGSKVDSGICFCKITMKFLQPVQIIVNQ